MDHEDFKRPDRTPTTRRRTALGATALALAVAACTATAPTPPTTAAPTSASAPAMVSTATPKPVSPSPIATRTPSPIARNPAMLDEAVPYRPAIDPADFSTTIDNPFWPLVPGTTFVYEGGGERIEVTVTADTRTVMGVETVVVRDHRDREGQGHRGHI